MMKIFIQRLQTLFILLCFHSFSFAQNKASVIVEVNPELELLSIVTYLSGNIQYVIPSNYEEKIKKEFKSFRKHPAVTQIKKIYKGQKVHIEAVHPMLAFYCSPLPELKPLYSLKYISTKDIELYLKYFRNFADETNFKEFFASQQKEMQGWIKPVQDTIAKYALADRLGDFFGEYKEFRIYLNPFNSWGGQAFTPNEDFVKTHAYFRLGYNVLNKETSGKDKPPFFNNKMMLFDLVWHEGGHTYMNILITKKIDLFAEAQILLNDKLQTLLKKAGSFRWEWEYFLHEQITRALVAYLFKKNINENAWKQECSRQEKIGFIYTKDISLLLEKFDLQRNQYGNFSNFIPEIAAYFKTQKPIL